MNDFGIPEKEFPLKPRKEVHKRDYHIGTVILLLGVALIAYMFYNTVGDSKAIQVNVVQEESPLRQTELSVQSTYYAPRPTSTPSSTPEPTATNVPVVPTITRTPIALCKYQKEGDCLMLMTPTATATRQSCETLPNPVPRDVICTKHDQGTGAYESYELGGH